MKQRQLGDSDLLISEISLGSWLTYSGGIEKAEAVTCIRTALDLGIDFFDTANVYGRGAAKTLLGEALQGVDRTSHILATKVYGRMSDTDQGLSRAQIFKQLDQSLLRLKTDYIDFYQCDRYDTETPLEETMEALSEVVRQGKVRYIGFSEWPIDRIEAAANLKGMVPFVSSQPQYSLLWPYPQGEIFPLCADYGITQIVWSPLAQGVLTGKYRPAAALPADSRASDKFMGEIFPKRCPEPQLLAAVQGLVPLAQEADLSRPQFALAWVLRQANVSSAIIGASRPAQVIESAAAASKRVSHELLRRAESIVGPFWQA